MNKKAVAIIIAVLVVVVVALGFASRSGDEDKDGIVIQYDGKETTVAWEDIQKDPFEGDLVNGKGEVSHGVYEGVELNSLLAANDIELSNDSKVTVTSEDNYSAELTGAEILAHDKVYVALTQNDEMIEGIEGEQGAQLIVLGDPNSKRAVRYMKIITIE